MLELFRLNESLIFPSIDLALNEPNGLLAFGGDLTSERLIEAYKHGIFPWFSEGEPILWWSPSPRAIIFTTDFTANKSLKKSIRKHNYKASLNTQFSDVIQHCAKVYRGKLPIVGSTKLSEEYSNDPVSTWITQDMIDAYNELHRLGFAHSIEVYDEHNKLVGGLYGVVVGGIFCGESMFHLKTDASKVALLALCTHMRKHGLPIIDCQLVNSHLTSLGCVPVKREEFKQMLSEHSDYKDCWGKQSLEIDT